MNWEQFKCRCCGKGEPTEQLRKSVEQLEIILGRELQCNSGYRCPEHNKDVGGAPNSTHTKRIACDLCDPKKDVTPKMIFVAAESLGFGGIHAYNTFCHVDLGRDRRW